jgi:phospholipid-translocating ATPase
LEILKVFEFDSNRKRMTVVIREGDLIKVYCKGADNVIKARLGKNFEQPYLNILSKKIDDFSKKGLRTLCVAMKVIGKKEFERIEKEWIDAEEKREKEQLQSEFKINLSKK